VFFRGRDAGTGYEPFVSDGTAAGTGLLRDVYVGASSSDPVEFVSTGELVFFSARTPTSRLLLKSDGTTAGTGLVKGVAAGGPIFPSGLTRFGSRVLFSAEAAGSGAEPWVSDGTLAGTFALGDLWPGFMSSQSEGFTPVGDVAVFAAEEPMFGRELYVTDGTPGGTQLLVDFEPGPGSGFPSNFTRWQGAVYFTARTPQTGYELWRTDGTAAGTQLVLDLKPGAASGAPSSLVPAGDRLFFAGQAAGSSDLLWELSAATGLPVLVSGVPFGESFVELPTIVPADGGVYFIGEDPALGRELHFAKDGTASVVCDLWPGSFSSGPRLGQVVGEHLVWLANDPVAGDEPRVLPIGGPRAVDLGFGGPALRLEVGAPLLGSAVSLRVDGGAPGELLLVAYGPRSEPGTALVAPGSALWLDPLTAQLVVIGSGPNLPASFSLPANPALAGVRAHGQAFGLAVGGLPLAASNGVAVELGS